MRKYLKSLGASAVAENTFVFPDAEVMLSEVEPLCVGSLTVGRLEVGVRASSAEREATLVAAIRLRIILAKAGSRYARTRSDQGAARRRLTPAWLRSPPKRLARAACLSPPWL